MRPIWSAFSDSISAWVSPKTSFRIGGGPHLTPSSHPIEVLTQAVLYMYVKIGNFVDMLTSEIYTYGTCCRSEKVAVVDLGQGGASKGLGVCGAGGGFFLPD